MYFYCVFPVLFWGYASLTRLEMTFIWSKQSSGQKMEILNQFTFLQKSSLLGVLQLKM